MNMTARERVLTAISHNEPDRVPHNLRLVPELLAMVESEIGTRDYADYFGHDVRYVVHALPPRPESVPVTEWTPRPAQEDIGGSRMRPRLYTIAVSRCAGCTSWAYTNKRKTGSAMRPRWSGPMRTRKNSPDCWTGLSIGSVRSTERTPRREWTLSGSAMTWALSVHSS